MANENDVTKDGLAFILFPNRLGTMTVVAIKPDQWEPFQDFIEVIPEDQVIDITPPLDERSVITPAVLNAAIEKVQRKMKREGEYVDWDERMKKLGLDD